MNDFERMDALAQDVLKLCRNTLLVHLRFLDRALSMFVYIPCPDGVIPGTGIPLRGGLATDGKHLYYAPKWVLRRYRGEQEALTRDYLHVVFHCVFHHAFVNTLIDIPLWNLACDIAVESAIEDLHIACTAARRSAEQQAAIARLRKEIKQLSAEKIYARLRSKNYSAARIELTQRSFSADSHDIWYDRCAVQGSQSPYGGGDANPGAVLSANPGVPFSENLAQEWGNIARRMQTDIESFLQVQGDRAGGLMQNLRAVTREKYDYSAFLRSFAVMSEAMRISDDTFDYVFYTYGMQLYGNMPLIEPLEYRDVKRIREFVIAIDTSGSVAGDTVQRFLNKTYNILQQQESFFRRINLHIIQCDADIQEDRRITSREEFDGYLKSMKLRGLGGTDFRPVFRYVDKLRAAGEFVNLKGLIYFTDGFGIFPAQQPDYRTAFVFIDDEYNNFNVPPWAIKLILQRSEV